MQAKDGSGAEQLHWAVQNGSVPAAAAAVAAGADCYAADGGGNPPLCLVLWRADAAGCQELVQLLPPARDERGVEGVEQTRRRKRVPPAPGGHAGVNQAEARGGWGGQQQRRRRTRSTRQRGEQQQQ